MLGTSRGHDVGHISGRRCGKVIPPAPAEIQRHQRWRVAGGALGQLAGSNLTNVLTQRAGVAEPGRGPGMKFGNGIGARLAGLFMKNPVLNTCSWTMAVVMLPFCCCLRPGWQEHRASKSKK